MERAVAPTATGTGNVLFELERLEQSGGGRLELRGRWFGVRGRRFVRPTLTLVADGRPHRLLADLEHKPWPAEDGGEWIAAFPWDRDASALTEIELSVAPDIEIQLAAADRDPAGGGGAELRDADAPARRELQRTWADLAAERRERERQARQLQSATGELAQAREELTQMRAAALQAEAAIARRDAAVAKLEAVEAERAEAAVVLKRALRERDEAAAARGQAVRERDEASAARDQAMTERDQAVREREQARREPNPAAIPAPQPDARPAPASSLPPIIHRPAARPPRTHDIGWLARGVVIAVLIGAIIALALVTRLL